MKICLQFEAFIVGDKHNGEEEDDPPREYAGQQVIFFKTEVKVLPHQLMKKRALSF
jgi:hypothetical protein